MQKCADHGSRSSGRSSLAAVTLAAAAVPTIFILAAVLLPVLLAAAPYLANQKDASARPEAAGRYDFKLRHLESATGIAGIAGIIKIAAHTIFSFHGKFDFP